jgi:hypothetical protein
MVILVGWKGTTTLLLVYNCHMDIQYKVAELHGGRNCAHFTAKGMEGAERNNPERPVSLMSLAARQDVDQAEKRGLCYQRFNADITLECTLMPEKGAFLASKDLTLRILPEGKRCFPECILLQEGLPCPLRDGVRYAAVEKPGKVCLGEYFTIVD